MPRYSIITPTVVRDSLSHTCASVDSQTCKDWEHLVIIDGIDDYYPPQEFSHPQRRVFHCAERHKNFGNTCRHDVWEYATGDYILYLDDDTYLADDNVLETLKSVTGPWAIFPIEKTWFTGFYFHCPPQKGFTDAGNMLIKREFGRYPDIENYEADGILAESLRQAFPYEVLLTRPLLIKPTK
jgi:glycosyltransferase involved in cell wall biosynthesis